MHAAAAKLLQLLLEVSGGALLPLHKSVTRLLAGCLRRLAADPPLFLATSSWLVRREVPHSLHCSAWPHCVHYMRIHGPRKTAIEKLCAAAGVVL